MRYLIIALIVLLPSKSFSKDNFETARYLHAETAPDFTDVSELVAYLSQGATNDEEIVETFFYWIGLNIDYDNELKNSGKITHEDISTKAVLTRKKAICMGYSRLFLAMCRAAKIECVVINGIAQNYLGQQTTGPNHSWNAVKIGDDWKLVDVTWGSGARSLNSNSFEKNIDTNYLLASPEFFIVDHLPQKSEWQLLDNAISYEDFYSSEWNAMRGEKFNNNVVAYEPSRNLQ